MELSNRHIFVAAAIVLCCFTAHGIGPRPFNENPADELAYADAVFTAQVLATVPELRERPYESDSPGFLYLLQIQSVWKGEPEATLWMRSPAPNDEPAPLLENGSTYLVYGSVLDGMLYTDSHYRGGAAKEILDTEWGALGDAVTEFPADDRATEGKVIHLFEAWVEAGNDVNGVFGDSGCTPLQIATINNLYKCAGVLVKLGAHHWADTPDLPITPTYIAQGWLTPEWRGTPEWFEFYEGDASNRHVVAGMFATQSREKALLGFIIVIFTALLIRWRSMTHTSTD